MEFITKTLSEITSLLVRELKTQFDNQTEVKIAEVEGVMRQMLQKIGVESLGAYLTQQDEAYPEPEIPCACGGSDQYQFRRSAKILTVFGWVEYRRAYYLCPRCHTGISPLDQRLGLEPGKVSAGLAPLLGLAGVQTSFGESCQLVEQFLMIEVSENTVRKETQDFGRLQMETEQEWITSSQDPEHYRERHRTADQCPKRLYGTLDGAHAPLQEEWREVKVGAWYEVETIPQKHVPAHRRDKVGETGSLRSKNITYYCDIQEAKQFGELVWATGCQQDADLAEELVFVADGAPWIWKLVDFYYPKAVQIVDWYHANEYIEKVAKAAFRDDQTAVLEWLKPVQTDLWEGRIRRVINACQEFENHPQAGSDAQKAITYYTNNQKRMDYARLRQAGYMIGSGTVESACKQIVSQRLKRSGARWKEDGARATAKARAAWLSGQWEQLSAKRSELPLAV